MLTAFRAGLSVFLAFHLLSVLLAPNAHTYLGAAAAPYVEPYVNFFEFTNAWSFFAPEPGPPPVFLEYELLDRKGESKQRGRWPSVESPFWLRDRQNRRIAAAEYMMVSEIRSERMMLHYLCQEFPGTGSARIWRVMHSIPGFVEVAGGSRKIGDEVNMERRLVSHSFCDSWQ